MTNAMTLQLGGSFSLQAVSERRRDERLRALLQSETDPDDADDANDGECARDDMRGNGPPVTRESMRHVCEQV